MTATTLFSLKWYTRQLKKERELSASAGFKHYLSFGEEHGCSPHPLFCPIWYRRQIRSGSSDPPAKSPSLLEHYFAMGEEAADPNPFFDNKWYHREYLSTNGDQNALVHYLTEGAKAGNLPSREFTPEVTSAYLSEKSDASQTALERWMRKFYWNPGPERKISQLESAPSRSFIGSLLSRFNAPVAEKAAKEKPNVLFISGEPDSASHVYRVDHMISSWSLLGGQATWLPTEKLTAAYSKLPATDLLVIFRSAMDAHLRLLISAARRIKIPVVFDIDDLNFLPELATVESMDVLRFFDKGEELFRSRFSKMAETLRAADFSTSPTSFLCEEQEVVSGRPSFVIPNGFAEETLAMSEQIRRKRNECVLQDSVVRLGYAAGTKTHQRDFKVIAPVLLRILKAYKHASLVLFRDKQGEPLVDLDEMGEGWADLVTSIEWRPFSPIHELVNEVARFDVNLAPLELEQRRCQAKSELKFFEAALVDVPTIASPTAPFQEAIKDGITGFLAANEHEWEEKLVRLIESSQLRREMAERARQEVLVRYSPERRSQLLDNAYTQIMKAWD